MVITSCGGVTTALAKFPSDPVKGLACTVVVVCTPKMCLISLVNGVSFPFQEQFI